MFVVCIVPPCVHYWATHKHHGHTVLHAASQGNHGDLKVFITKDKNTFCSFFFLSAETAGDRRIQCVLIPEKYVVEPRTFQVTKQHI